MYPTQELNRLASHRARLERRIFKQRNQLSQDTALMLEPLIVMKPYLLVVQAVSPIAVLFLNRTIGRSVYLKIRKLNTLKRWIPLLRGTLRIFRFIGQKPC